MDSGEEKRSVDARSTYLTDYELNNNRSPTDSEKELRDGSSVERDQVKHIRLSGFDCFLTTFYNRCERTSLTSSMNDSKLSNQWDLRQSSRLWLSTQT